MSEQLPRTVIPVEKIEIDSYDWYQRHDSKVAAAASGQYDLVFIGDSITHFMAGEDGPPLGEGIWQDRIAPRFRALNLGYGFDRTQNVLWRLEHDELAGQNPKLLVLNIGTNQYSVTQNYSGDTPEIAAQGVIAVIRKLREMFPAMHIVVMAVFPRNAAADDPMRAKIAGLNAIVKEFAEAEPNCEFLDISASFVHPDGSIKTELFADGICHPNRKGYEIWLDALEDAFCRYL